MANSRPDTFKPARPSALLLTLVQQKLKRDLQKSNAVEINPADLARLTNLPADCGIILTPNHADETDPRVCLDLSRRCRRLFIFMCNREAFGEGRGLTGLLLQAIGYFSVERGGHDLPAKNYSVQTVKDGKAVLVIFPEGEIFYLNETLQPFHSGAIDIGMQAIIEKRKTNPQWTTYLVPLALKYSYVEPIEKILEARISRMEKRLQQKISNLTLQKRLSIIQRKLLAQEESRYKIKGGENDPVNNGNSLGSEHTQLGQDDRTYAADLAKLSVRIAHARQLILEQVEGKSTASFNSQARTIDQAWQVSAHLREKLNHNLSPAEEKELKAELQALSEVAQLVSWQPEYVGSSPSNDRMAEMVIKLERELYRIKRPKQLARRKVAVHTGEPIDLGPHLDEYLTAPHQLRHKLAGQLKDVIQALINQSV